jgi:hypothetical protein
MDFFFFQHETIAGYRAYIHGIVGFFVVEDHVLNTGNGLVNRTYMDEVWSMALSKIVNALRTHSVSNINIYTSDMRAVRPVARRVQEGAMHPLGFAEHQRQAR